MLKTVIEIGVVVSTILLGGCVTTVQYEIPHDVIRIYHEPHYRYYAYAPKPRPRRLYFYNQLWYDEPSTVVIRSSVDRVRVPNSRLTTHFRTAPKRRNIDKEFKEMYRKRNDQLLNKKNEQRLKKGRNINESTRIKRDPKRTKGISRRNQQRRGSRPKQRPSSGNDSGKDSNRVRVHDGDSGKRRRSDNPRQR